MSSDVTPPTRSEVTQEQSAIPVSETAVPSPTPTGPFPQPFGRYELRQHLGGGGMGDVYRAYDPALKREVALKVPKQQLLDNYPPLRVQFLHEAQALACFHHPHICPIYEYGTVGDTPYLTMPLLQGQPLTGGPRAPLHAADLVRTLARALAAMHDQALIHRDLKLSNILVCNGQPILIDFGLALRLNEADAHRPDRAVGTLPYMAPEQLDVQRAPLGPAGDIYALGVILFELLTGRRPFPGPTAQLKHQILHDPPPSLPPGLPAELDAICRKALAKRVRERFIHMTELAEALTRWIENPNVATMATTPAAPPRPPVDRSQVGFEFVGYGTPAPPTAPRDRLYLDLGSALRPGVIDHHQLVMSPFSSTQLVLRRPDLLDAAVDPQRSGDAPFTLVTHEFPDLDSTAAAYLAIEYLATDLFPDGAAPLADYVDAVEEGRPGLALAQPFTLYAAHRVLADRQSPDASVDPVTQWRQAMDAGIRLVRYVVEQAVRRDVALKEVDAFACPGLFRPSERDAVQQDVQRYQRKLTNKDCQARAVRLRLPGRFGGREEVEALLVRDVQNEIDPERVLYFKDWARTDAKRSGNGKGFVALSVFMSEGAKQRRGCILSVTPDGGVLLSGLGQLLDEAETKARIKLSGRDDRRDEPARPGYANADPWYDGRAHGYTIVDAPRSGTVLTADEIEALFLDYGHCSTQPRPLT